MFGSYVWAERSGGDAPVLALSFELRDVNTHNSRIQNSKLFKITNSQFPIP
ncbi:MAG: hypothetical protein HC849_11810 [Oscillatoriales cyanobacterium RU_3_3]|nr:hypothetical protein [Oscillatoriales cyanobacterium RU_3_3]